MLLIDLKKRKLKTKTLGKWQNIIISLESLNIVKISVLPNL